MINDIKYYLGLDAKCLFSLIKFNKVLIFLLFIVYCSLSDVNCYSQVICRGDTISLNLTVFRGKLQWQESADSITWNDIAGATEKHCVLKAISPKYYRAKVNEGTCNPVYSGFKKITIYPVSVGGTAIASPGSVCVGSNTTLSLSGYTGNIQWQSSTDNNTYTNLTNANSPLSTINDLQSTSYYRAYVISGTCAGSYSNIIKVTVSPILPVSVVISASPSGAICSGTSVTFKATATNGGTSPAYQWELNGNSIGTNNSSFTSSTLANGNIVTCVMTSDAACISGSPDTSNSVIMSVNFPPSAPVAGTNSASQTQIVWNWQIVSGATGYKWNVVNDYNTATDNSLSTSYTQNGLPCGASNTLYVWAYNDCGSSTVTTLTQNTTACVYANCGTVKDNDGNVYNTVLIGSQCWMQQNLKTTTFRDGNQIPLITNNVTWLNASTDGYCWYKNDAATYKATYGALYNWFAANDNRLCPTGWHVPDSSEWFALIDSLGGVNKAGGKMKEAGTAYWVTPNTGATNSSGFTALPAGYRDGGIGLWYDLGYAGYWWSTTEDFNSFFPWFCYLVYNTSVVNPTYPPNTNTTGFSVRCVQD